MIQERIVEDIVQCAAQAEDSQKLTWNALHSLKSQEIALNEQMTEEIEAIKEKYEMLKQPIFSQVSAAVLGDKLDEKYYSPEGVEKTVKDKNVKP